MGAIGMPMGPLGNGVSGAETFGAFGLRELAQPLQGWARAKQIEELTTAYKTAKTAGLEDQAVAIKAQIDMLLAPPAPPPQMDEEPPGGESPDEATP
jgi:hypothetical protein